MDNISQKREITSADANTNVKIAGSGGILNRIVIGTTSAHALTLYDTVNTTTPDGRFGLLKASIAEQSIEFGIALEKGLVVTVPSGYVGTATFCFRELK